MQGENGETPPSLWQNEKTDESKQDIAEHLSNFGDSMISGSARDMHCDEHERFTENCEQCEEGMALVLKYQSHRHTFTCKKKGKVIKILPGEGHGRLDGAKEEEMLLVPVCRFRHPRNPIDKTEFIFSFPDGFDEDEYRKAKADYLKIRKYLSE